jgi:hypothetical protein
MEAVCFCNKSVDLHQATWGDVPENDTFQLLYWSHEEKLIHLTEKLDAQLVVFGSKSPFFQDHFILYSSSHTLAFKFKPLINV